MKLPPEIKSIVDQVAEMVSPCYLVGGSVRDILLGRKTNDLDFCCKHTPDEIEDAVRAAGRRAYLVGKKFGTIGCKVGGQKIEITTFRQESYKNGYRKPEVEFVGDIVSDLSRRDFTINAMAIRDNGKFIDPFNGRTDLKEGIIECVGSPKTRFREDPLRILRAARFLSQLDNTENLHRPSTEPEVWFQNFGIEMGTFNKMKELSYKLLSISKERWVMELDKILESNKPDVGLYALMETKCFNFMIPELSLQDGYDQNSSWHSLPLWQHTLEVVRECPPELNLRWAALLHDCAKPFVRVDKKDPVRGTYAKHDILGYEMVKRIGLHLKWSNDRIKNVSELVRDHLSDDSPLKEFDDRAKG
ncbi:MAG: HD domain-containing protein [Phycisphaerae bacterium]|jgi:tRNA nucleotidyltransferase (CCA-adding enzyme)